MDRRVRTFAVVGLLVGVVIVSAFSLGLFSPQPEPLPFSWAVAENDTLSYEIVVYRYSGHEFRSYDLLNHTIVNFNITSLPDLGGILDSTQFTEMIEILKVSLLPPILHENGTEVVTTGINLVHGIISKTVLPVNGWSYIDSFYDESASPIECEFVCRHYYSHEVNGTFTFGYLYYMYDGGDGWYATMDKTTGLPSRIVWWHDDFIIHRHYEIYMTPTNPG